METIKLEVTRPARQVPAFTQTWNGTVTELFDTERFAVAGQKELIFFQRSLSMPFAYGNRDGLDAKCDKDTNMQLMSQLPQPERFSACGVECRVAFDGSFVYDELVGAARVSLSHLGCYKIMDLPLSAVLCGRDAAVSKISKCLLDDASELMEKDAASPYREDIGYLYDPDKPFVPCVGVRHIRPGESFQARLYFTRAIPVPVNPISVRFALVGIKWLPEVLVKIGEGEKHADAI